MFRILKKDSPWAPFQHKTFRLREGENIDNAPSGHWPTPLVDEEPSADRGPVMITIEYQVSQENRQQFKALMQQLRLVRKRDGAFFWSLFSDVEDANRIVETFMTESWLEHLRQHERITNSDRILQEKIADLCDAKRPPVVSHYVATE
ncbi:MAG: MFS transporter [Thiohalomonadales bacterium]